jgi:ATP-binding cassette subfamily C protein
MNTPRSTDANVLAKYRESIGFFESLVREAGQSTPGADGFNPLNACQYSLGVCLSEIYCSIISHRSPKLADLNLKGQQLITRFCQDNALQWRQVSLSAQWYRNDAGILLAFTNEELYPCVLRWDKSHRGGQYLATSPKLAEPVWLDQVSVDRFLPYAYCFYPTLRGSSLRLKHLLPLIRQASLGSLGITLLISLCIALITLLPSFLLAQIIGDAIPNASLALLSQYAVLLSAALISSNLLNLVRNQLLLRLQAQLAMRLAASLWDRILQLPIPHLNTFTASELTQRSEGILSVQNVLSGQSTVVAIDGILALFNIALMVYYAGFLSALSLVICIALALFSIFMIRTSLGFLFERSKLNARVIGLTQGLLGLIETLRVSASEVNGIREWARLYSGQQRLDQRIARLNELSSVTGKGIGSSLSLGILIFAAVVINNPSNTQGLSVASLLGFNSALGVFLGSFLQLTAVLTTQHQQIDFLWRRLQPVLDHPPESGVDSLSLKKPPQAITIRDLCFAYPSSKRLIIDGLSISIQPGQHVALVGSSGSGKTTLVRLLLGFEQAHSGYIGYEGIDLKRLNLAGLRHHIGIVLQDIELLSGTIGENVSAGRALDEQDIWNALAQSAMAEKVAAMPLKLNTPVISGGGNLSGGERQRIMLARALAQQPSILIMDEATSALDNKAQAVVEAAVSLLDCTRLTIAHRLSTIQKADRIIMLEAGRVAEDGTFLELVRRRGSFYRLIQSQLQAQGILSGELIRTVGEHAS